MSRARSVEALSACAPKPSDNLGDDGPTRWAPRRHQGLGVSLHFDRDRRAREHASLFGLEIDGRGCAPHVEEQREVSTGVRAASHQPSDGLGELAKSVRCVLHDGAVRRARGERDSEARSSVDPALRVLLSGAPEAARQARRQPSPTSLRVEPILESLASRCSTEHSHPPAMPAALGIERALPVARRGARCRAQGEREGSGLHLAVPTSGRASGVDAKLRPRSRCASTLFQR